MHAFKSGDDSKNKVKSIGKFQAKHINFDEHKNCLDGEDYQKQCDNYIIRSINHEMHLHRGKKSTRSFFDAKRCYINSIESKPSN